VTTNDAFITHLLTPMFASFCKAYPDIRLEVIIANQSLNLSKRDADVAIRATAKPAESLVGRRITTLQWAAYAPRRWAEEGRALDGDDIPWVGFSEPLSHLNAAEWINSTIGPRRIPYRVDTVLGVTRAVEAEIGLGLLPCFIGDQSPLIVRHGGRRGEVAGESLWLLTHADLKNSARVRAFMDHMAVEFSKVRRLLEGEI
jgi:DNA-binding transcriptional LysR family regulator